MNKRLLLTIILVLVVFAGIVVWKSTASSAAIQQTKSIPSSENSSVQMNDANMSNKNKDELLQDALSKQLKILQQQPGNITEYLNNFKANCTMTDCNAALAKALANYPDAKLDDSDIDFLVKETKSDTEFVKATIKEIKG